MAWRLWARGLFAAILNALGGAITLVVVSPQDFNLRDGLTNLGTVALVLGLQGFGTYIKQHPDPWDELRTSGRSSWRTRRSR